MLLTHGRELENTPASVSTVGLLDLPGTGTPSIFVRVKQDDIVNLIRKNDSFYSLDDDELFAKIVGYLNYQLQSEHPFYFVSIAKGTTNTVNVKVKNAFKLLEHDDTDIARENLDDPQDYSSIRSDIASSIKQHVNSIARNSQQLRDFIAKTSSNKKWDAFVEVREKHTEQETIAEALNDLNNKLKMYYLDGEFLSLDRYNSTIPAIYYYDCQCRTICMFSLKASTRIIETVVKACAEISSDGETFGNDFYKRNADVFSKEETPSLQDISTDYIRVAYEREISIWANYLTEKLSNINAKQNFLLIEITELVVNRFHNGFVIGHFLQHQQANDL